MNRFFLSLSKKKKVFLSLAKIIFGVYNLTVNAKLKVSIAIHVPILPN